MSIAAPLPSQPPLDTTVAGENRAPAEVSAPVSAALSVTANEVEDAADSYPTGDSSEPLYRTLSIQALIGLCLSLLSILAYFDGWLATLAFGGAYLGWRAHAAIRENPESWYGARIAKYAMVLGVVNFALSISLNSYIYATEVPAGHRRINYELLQPDPAIKGQRLPEFAHEINGQPVFIKGFIHPATPAREGIQTFILVRDRKECCFGNTPKITDKILVQVANPNGIDFTNWVVKASGKFRIDMSQPDVVYYQLDGATVK